MATDSVKKTVGLAFSLCVFCSLLVSGAAVFFKDIQIENKKLDVKKNLLVSAGLLKAGKSSKESILEVFKQVETIVVNLQTGKEAKDIDVEADQSKWAKDPEMGKRIAPENDLAKIKRREKFSKVYLVKKDGELDLIILPVYGKGLWSTMYGFLALDKDIKTVRGFGFYQHGETPGLGGEVDNKNWKESWKGKVVLGENEEPIIEVIKGSVDPKNPKSISQVDGLSGATITSRGVHDLLHYWLGENGFGPFLSRVSQGSI